MQNKFLGVITGDLYRSTAGFERGKSYESIMDALKISLYNTNRYHIDTVDFFRGDSFQITVEPAFIIELATYIRSHLLSLSDDTEDIKYDARMSIVIDKVNIYSKTSKNFYEKAFIDSGRALDAMPKNKMIIFNSDIEEIHTFIGAGTQLLDFLLNQLSKPQAEVLKICIDQGMIDATSIATISNKSRQNIYKLLSRAGVENIMEYLRLTRTGIQNQLKEHI
ncbi:hypothetical protein J7S99_03680 [Providencia rettgeri]|uniref:hypothetical protein n=1 Tax=Providencia rettgeri TaxID=587 RepID=UPI001B39022C|nr:hypothetical protein [Providencia rettgeri]MBQ0396702.1 hypothetical protein [Providencia rettgeri]